METDALRWFSLQILYPITSSITTEEELGEIDKIIFDNENKSNGIFEGYEVDTGYFNLATNTITQLNPKCFVPKGKTNRKFYTQVVFEDGDIIYSPGKPDTIYEKLIQYYTSFPESELPKVLGGDKEESS